MKINKIIKLFTITIITTTLFGSFLNAGDNTNQNFLNNHIDSLLIYNQELISLEKDYKASTFKGKQNSAFPDPVISGGYNIIPVETRLGPQIAKVSLNQKIPWFSLLNTRENIANLSAEIKKLKLENKKKVLTVEFKKVILDIYLLRTLKKYKNEILELQRLYNDQLLSNLENNTGKTDQISFLRSEIIVEKIIEEISDIDVKLNLEFAKLNNLTDNQFTELVEIETPHSITNMLLEFKNNYYDDEKSELSEKNSLIDKSYTVQIQLLKEVISGLSIEEADEEGNPNFAIGLDYVFIGEREDMIVEDSGKDAIIVKAQMTIPFFSGKYGSKVEEKEILLLKDRSVLQNIKNELKLQIEKIYTKKDILGRKINLQKSILTRLEDIKNLTDISYSTGISKFKKSMDILKEFYLTKIVLEKNRVEKLKQYLELEKI